MSGSTRARRVLIALAAVLVLANLGLLGAKSFATGLLPDSWTAADRAADRNATIEVAARKAMTSFVNTDYRTIEKNLDATSALATGNFKKEFDNTRVQYMALSRQSKAVGTGEVKAVGITRSDDASALVTVAVNQTVLNKSVRQAIAKGQKVDNVRLYTFQLTLEAVRGKWLVAELKVIG